MNQVPNLSLNHPPTAGGLACPLGGIESMIACIATRVFAARLGALACAAVLTLLAACTTAELTDVTIRDSEFRIIKTLSSSELAVFQRLWSKKKMVQEPCCQYRGLFRTKKEEMQCCRLPNSFAYKIDIEFTPKGESRPKGGGRWLYDSDGITQVLSKAIVPSFQIESPERFNQLLGIEAEKISSQPSF